MKQFRFTIFIFLLISFILPVQAVYSQDNYTIDINDKVYVILRSAETQDLCTKLSNVKPYTKSYIITKLEEIKYNLDDQERYDEIEIIDEFIDKYDFQEGLNLAQGYIKFDNHNMSFPNELVFADTLTFNLGSGFYTNSQLNATGYELYNTFKFFGNMGETISYKCNGFIGVTKMPLHKMGTYEIGCWLYSGDRTQQDPRTINVYHNNAFLPYSYNKYWDGSVYFLTNIDASGLEGWPFYNSLAFGMTGEIRASFYDDAIQIGIGRNRREWGAMDKDSSLILNSHARPFLAMEASFTPFEYLSLSTLTGVLEMPNQSYINADAWYLVDEKGHKTKWIEDTYFFQNAFSMIMVEFDTKKFHFDFGSTCVWPKRFELGYAFPLIDNVIYQNDVGDNDNLALFTNIKYTLPGIGSVWFSGYLDEINAFTTKFWEKARAMFAFQSGLKANIPFLPFTTASFRYTKVEPYCYTHHSINYTPWYTHYIQESYTNNGESLGYYLAPNSDEFNLQIDSNINSYLSLGLQYQLIRHGVDWGSGSVIGSNLYSELRNTNRDDLYKYFLHDGTYEWTNIISLCCDYNFKQFNVPLNMHASVGYIYEYYTQINDEPGWKTSYSRVNNSEYPTKNGAVANLEMTVLFN